MKKTTMPGMPEVEVVEIKTSAPVNVLADQIGRASCRERV